MAYDYNAEIDRAWIKLCEEGNPENVTFRLSNRERDALIRDLIQQAMADEKGPAADVVKKYVVPLD